MHLTANTINLGNAVLLPLADPMNQTLEFLVVSSFEVIIIDEELQLLRISTSISKALASCSYSSANILKVTQVILPVEIILGIIGRNCTTCGRLELVETIAILICTRDSLVYNIPSLHLALGSFHHAVNPLLQNRSKYFLLFLISQRFSIGFFDLTNLNRMYIQSSICCLWFQDNIIITSNNIRHRKFYGLTTSRNRYTYSNSLGTATPTILHSQFYSTSSLGRSHIQINHIITLRKPIFAT